VSHTSSIKSVKITSISALTAAIDELSKTGVRCTLKTGGTPRAFYSNQAGLGNADYVLELAGAKYDVGFYKQEDGSYEARTDFWGGTVQACLGAAPSKPETAEQAKMGKLFQLYAGHAATETARKKGLSVRRINGTDGKIKLELTGANL
jgi:Protein of unknown function (DUF1257)